MTSAALDTDNDEDRRLFEISDFDIGMNAAALNEELLVQDVPGEIVVSGKVDKVVESEREEKAEARPATCRVALPQSILENAITMDADVDQQQVASSDLSRSVSTGNSSASPEVCRQVEEVMQSASLIVDGQVEEVSQAASMIDDGQVEKASQLTSMIDDGQVEKASQPAPLNVNRQVEKASQFTSLIDYGRVEKASQSTSPSDAHVAESKPPSAWKEVTMVLTSVKHADLAQAPRCTPRDTDKPQNTFISNSSNSRPPSKPPTSTSDAMAMFYGADVSASTIKLYACYARAFFRWCEASPSTTKFLVTPEAIEQFFKWRRNNGFRPWKFALVRRAINSVHRCQVEAGINFFPPPYWGHIKQIAGSAVDSDVDETIGNGSDEAAVDQGDPTVKKDTMELDDGIDATLNLRMADERVKMMDESSGSVVDDMPLAKRQRDADKSSVTGTPPAKRHRDTAVESSGGIDTPPTKRHCDTAAESSSGFDTPPMKEQRESPELGPATLAIYASTQRLFRRWCATMASDPHDGTISDESSVDVTVTEDKILEFLHWRALTLNYAKEVVTALIALYLEQVGAGANTGVHPFDDALKDYLRVLKARERKKSG